MASAGTERDNAASETADMTPDHPRTIADDEFRRIYAEEKARWAELSQRLK